METTIWGLGFGDSGLGQYGENGKEHGNYYIWIIWVLCSDIGYI